MLIWRTSQGCLQEAYGASPCSKIKVDSWKIISKVSRVVFRVSARERTVEGCWRRDCSTWCHSVPPCCGAIVRQTAPVPWLGRLVPIPLSSRQCSSLPAPIELYDIAICDPQFSQVIVTCQCKNIRPITLCSQTCLKSYWCHDHPDMAYLFFAFSHHDICATTFFSSLYPYVTC